MTTASIVVNGEEHDLAGLSGIADLVALYAPGCAADGAPRGVAVAINDHVVPRGRWTDTALTAGDRVEIVTAVQGG